MKVYHMSPGLMTRGRLNRSWSREQQLEYLQAEGVTQVVTLTEQGEPRLYPAPDWLKVTHIPLSDARASFNNPAWVVNHAVMMVVEHIRKGGTVLVMCRAGQNRAQLITALALCELEHWHGWEAIDHVRAIRPNALTNQRFVEWIEAVCP